MYLVKLLLLLFNKYKKANKSVLLNVFYLHLIQKSNIYIYKYSIYNSSANHLFTFTYQIFTTHQRITYFHLHF